MHLLLDMLTNASITIQRFWRDYLSRRDFQMAHEESIGEETMGEESDEIEIKIKEMNERE
jgi:hypothetical protein